MNNYINALKSYLTGQEKTIDRDDPRSVLDLLFYIYISEKPLQSAVIRRRFQQIAQVIGHLSLEDNDKISDLVCDLCAEHARRAFLEGIRVGFSLNTELFETASPGKE